MSKAASNLCQNTLRRQALIVGVDYYNGWVCNLAACVSDANAVKHALEYNSDGTRNFHVDLDLGLDYRLDLTRDRLKKKLEEIFESDLDVALFYFAGHGGINRAQEKPDASGFFVTQDALCNDDCLSMEWLIRLANRSAAKNRVIILDCCHAGDLGNLNEHNGHSLLSRGVTVIAATEKDDYSVESESLSTGKSGVFTALLVDAINGGAANVLGEVTAGSVYAYIEQALSSWDQRPVFKCNVKEFIPLRRVTPAIEPDDVKEITTLFAEADQVFPLDPSYEPTSPSCNPDNTKKFSVLQKLNRINLVTPVNVEHMYYAAMNSTGCRLTAQGKHYWHLISRGVLG